MSSLRVSVMPVCFRIEDPYEAIRTAATLNVEAVHLSIPWGDMTFEAMTPQKCKEVVAFVRDLGMVISATSCGIDDLGDPSDKCAKLEWARRSLEIARDLECGVWQTHVGIVPADHDAPRWASYVDLLTGIGALGEQIGACLATETGPEPPRVLADLIQTVGSDAIRVNLDPANLIWWPAYLAGNAGQPYDKAKAMADFDPVAGTRMLAPYIAHTHAKDALVTEDGKPLEVPLGEGWVDWPAYIGVLRQAGYDGYFAIEREVGGDPVGDTARAVEFLRTL
jgi:L-ribulose-5-phosphate 3-epimerase